MIDAVHELRWGALPGIDPRARALCDLAYKMSGTPAKMAREDWQPLRDLNFSDEALLEVAHIVGIFNYLTRLADGLGLELDDAVVEAARTKVPLKKPD